MRNLIRISNQAVPLDPGLAEPCLAIDSPSATLYYPYFSDQSGAAVGIAAQSAQGVTRLFPIADLHDSVVDIQYIPEYESVCVITNAGAVYLVPVHSDDAIQLVGVFDDGVAAASWSSDRERCVIATLTKKLVIIAHDWDVVDEIDIDDIATQISWRGDNLRFSAVIGSAIYLFDQNGAMIARTIDDEFTHDAIIGCAAFRPSGDLIAVAVDHNAGSKGVERRVVLLEGANCLRHGQWTIDSTEPITGISWSADSAAVAIAMTSSVLIFERNNYRWYLKSEIVIEAAPLLIKWDLERSLRLHLVTSDVIRIIDFSHDVDRSDSGAVAVVDGKRILVTDFSRMVIPPPMSMIEYSSLYNLISLSWSSNQSLAALTSHNTISIYDTISNISINSSTIGPAKTISIESGTAHQIAWASPDSIVVLRSTSSGDALVFINLNDVRDQNSVSLPARALRLGRDGVQLGSGRILRYHDLTSLARIAAPCPHFYTTNNGIAIGLDDAGRLYVNDTLLAQSASSFAVVSDTTLLFTTTGAQHVLHAADLNADAAVTVHSQRHLERGAVLVAVVPALDRVVLQMLPRGSLETIYPRALLLRSVSKLLHARQWTDAFHCLRRHRLDFNLLYDADPEAFTADIDAFVAGVGDAALLNEFVAALIDVNTRDTIYTEYRPVVQPGELDHHDYDHLQSLAVGEPSLIDHHHHHDLKAPVSDGKVNHICRLIVAATADIDRLVLARLGALLKQRPPQHEHALTLIGGLPVDQRPAALRFVTSVVEVDVLYDAALGLYDFDVVRMVGRVSDKDPHEYLNLIRDLSALSSIEQRIAIDMQLHRYEKVLHHLAQIDPVPVERIVVLLRDHPDLFQIAFTLFPAQSTILTAFAESSLCDDAGMAYIAGGDQRRALQAYCDSSDWRRALNLAYELGDVDVVELARSLAQAMTVTASSAQVAHDAAYLFADVCADIDAAVDTLCQNELWSEALLTARRHRRDDLLDGTIESSIVKASRRHASDLTYATDRFRYCIGRLRQVRLSSPSPIDDDDRFDERTQTETNLSAYTLTSQVSVQSWASTPWSNISSVGRRERKSKKKAAVKIREGDAREPDFLKKQVRALAPDTDKLDKIGNMIRVLIGRGRFDQAADLQGQFDTFLALVRNAIEEMPELEISVPSDNKWRVPFLPERDQRGEEDKQRLDVIREDGDEGAAFELF